MTRPNSPRQLAAGAFRRLARATGHDVVAHNFYSPIPAVEELPADVFDRRSPLRGIDLDLEAPLAYLNELEPGLSEFESPPLFGWDNRTYGAVEADVLHAIVRHERPARILELGSGVSSLVIAAAARRNAVEGHPAVFAAYDPYAREFVRQGIDGMQLHAVSATDVALAEFEALDRHDVLFVDTTHTVKLGSDVNRIILDVLPKLAPGVLVHFHDVFLPYEYPRAFLERRLYWSEQYLLQAFLAQNPAWEIVLPLHALVRERPQQLAGVVRSFRSDAGPSAFWIRPR
jgi:predicted O-methyltransferase YrrM